MIISFAENYFLRRKAEERVDDEIALKNFDVSNLLGTSRAALTRQYFIEEKQKFLRARHDGY